MARNTKLVLLRLDKEQRKLQAEGMEQSWVAREGVLNFHFCLHSLDGAYEGGYYHGLLQLSEQYPFAPPKLLFFTPSGRFEVNTPICTSFTNFHKQTWTSSWNVRTMILATISFMNSQEFGAGYLNSTYLTRRQYAKQSLDFNRKNPLFRQLFKKQLSELEKTHSKLRSEQNMKNSKTQKQKQGNDSPSDVQNWKMYGLYILLAMIVVLWIVSKNR